MQRKPWLFVDDSLVEDGDVPLQDEMSPTGNEQCPSRTNGMDGMDSHFEESLEDHQLMEGNIATTKAILGPCCSNPILLQMGYVEVSLDIIWYNWYIYIIWYIYTLYIYIYT